MPQDASLNSDAASGPVLGSFGRVAQMQAKLHRWAAADSGRLFDDRFNLVHDPATLVMAFDRVAGNRGARSPGVDGLTVADLEEQIGVPGFLNDLRAQLKAGTFWPLPVQARWPGQRLYLIVDNFYRTNTEVTAWMHACDVELVFLLTYASWLNWIDAYSAALRYFGAQRHRPPLPRRAVCRDRGLRPLVRRSHRRSGLRH